MILSMKDWGIIMDIMVVINQMIQLFLIIGLGYFMQKKNQIIMIRFYRD